MRPEAFDAEWAKANLRRVWRDQAPKRFLKAWDAENGGANKLVLPEAAPAQPTGGEVIWHMLMAW